MSTPAPWNRVKPIGSRYWTIGVIRDHVAAPLESEEDWRVAEAAPDLLEVARAIVAQGEGIDCVEGSILWLARRAVAKTEGKVPQ